jgi:polyhydroxyalkanoate synthesis regulator phasin
MLSGMEKKPPLDNSKNRFEEVIRQSKERRAELNNKAKKKQMEDIELPPRDEEIVVDSKEDDEPAI